jgi:H+/Cl- antiporter ClcA
MPSHQKAQVVPELSQQIFGLFLFRCLERDSKLLRNVALIVTVAWFYQILNSTAQLLITYSKNTNTQQTIIGLDNQFFSNFLFTIIVGILIGVASVLLIYIVNKSAKGFFKKEEKPEEL